MAKKWVQFNGRSWEEIGSGGGGGSSHTHPNLSLLNSLTQTMVTSWNAAATWVSTNGANVLSHLSDTVKHITSAERTAWNTASDWVTTNGANVLSHIADGLLHIPSGGVVGQVLKKTASGTEWADESGGGGGGGAVLVNVGTGRTVTFSLSGATAVVVRANYSSRDWSTTIPVDWMTATNQNWGIALSNTYIGLTVKNESGTCTITANYDITCYRVVGGGGGTGGVVTDEDITMTDYNGNLREAYAFAGESLLLCQQAVYATSDRVDAIESELSGINAILGSGVV